MTREERKRMIDVVVLLELMIGNPAMEVICGIACMPDKELRAKFREIEKANQRVLKNKGK